MDGNVQKINLDELKKAREALNTELGISNPEPPKKPKVEKEISDTTEEPVQKVEEKVEEVTASLPKIENIEKEEESEIDKDLSVYDNFSQFEINSEAEVPSIVVKKENQEEFSEFKNDLDDENEEEESEKEEDVDGFIDMLEEFLGDDLLEDYAEDIDPELEELLNGDPDNIDIDKLLDGIDGTEIIEESEEQTDIDEVVEDVVEEENVVENNVEEKPVIEQKTITQPKPVAPQKPTQPVKPVVSEKKPVIQSSTPTEKSTSSAVKSVITPKENAKPVSKIVDSKPETKPVVAESQPKPFAFKPIEKPQEPVQPKPVQNEPRIQFNVDKGSVNGKTEEVFDASKYLPKIADKKFIEIIRSKSFMSTDNFTCIYGIQEDENVFCQNFKDFYNTIVFSENDNDENIFNLFSSIIMSLLLKNSKYDINFAICDAKSGGPFTVYNDLSYMFIDKVAETNRDIIQCLKTLSKEIDSRYEALAKANAKSIEKFNDEMKKAHIVPLPYIILFFNNYTRASHLDDSNEIDTNLSYILRFGRLVGVHVCLVSYDENLIDSVNFNLQTRIAFKTELQETSISQIGENGAEDIGYNDEYVVKTLYSDKLIHLKPTKISQKEIELLIKNIEK